MHCASPNNTSTVCKQPFWPSSVTEFIIDIDINYFCFGTLTVVAVSALCVRFDSISIADSWRSPESYSTTENFCPCTCLGRLNTMRRHSRRNTKSYADPCMAGGFLGRLPIAAAEKMLYNLQPLSWPFFISVGSRSGVELGWLTKRSSWKSIEMVNMLKAKLI